MIFLFAACADESTSEAKKDAGEPQAAEATATQPAPGIGSLTCDCAALIPIKYRPDFPKVAGDSGPGCRYTGMDQETRELSVGLDAQANDEQFQQTRARWQSKFVKIHDSNTRALDDGGQAVVSVAADDLGLTRFTVAEFLAPGIIATIDEPLSDNPSSSPAPGFPTYIDGLGVGVESACQGEQ